MLLMMLSRSIATYAMFKLTRSFMTSCTGAIEDSIEEMQIGDCPGCGRMWTNAAEEPDCDYCGEELIPLFDTYGSYEREESLVDDEIARKQVA